MRTQKIMYVSVISLNKVQNELDNGYVVVSVTPVFDKHVVVVIERLTDES